MRHGRASRDRVVAAAAGEAATVVGGAAEADPAATTLAAIESRKCGATRSFRMTRQIDPTRNRRGARAGPTAILLFRIRPILIRASGREDPGLSLSPRPCSSPRPGDEGR